MSLSLVFLNGLASSPCSTAAPSKSRSSLGLSGFWAENKIASNMNFSSMSVSGRGGLAGRGGLGRRAHDVNISKILRLRANQLLKPDQLEQRQKCANNLRA